ncbi:MAG TPA: UDP-N-acetyl-D-glucosamine dehydrogenase [Elusimicrobia bacterium]|nr:MAG: UDP-N-acetyl-D-glucosamine dehydrogenase [Elusimicrobia bacterium RIFOXYA12_FULL_49_49]OGS10314.1 MAG: UDP-N-acetyl-D-glucosamine dehydrogenase [Elusimicrobia bacterium RIFOXYB1_FULL_48_9]OGS15970.1 MAG: UDP-N-acetyl-D-glucosamine dehydrogenase [Elusimicrobia bacterium RIFOXYA2_FULL_47_53]OGS26350.1 MAG: UDP-N-acetyl-D-glucosamine dehydrogenase [Elusimicrobia bacterium RIFOXYB12_FULL_50_12]OGS29138.1 MAG: UDP-N-acetyl-D-glucosamine dehydrogenase [Elusimicrobia bacterium RIFOXYB2_FULL_46
MYLNLKQKVAAKSAKVGIIGLGYVGLPLAVQLAKSGFSVLGFEVDSSKVKNVKSSRSYIGDVTSEDLAGLVRKKTLGATTDFKKLRSMDCVIICVPTPLRKSKDPDVSYIVSATQKVADSLKKGQLIILESTTYPGTTQELVRPMLEKTGLKCGRDFFLAFSPERVDPGNSKYDIHNTPKVVGGVTTHCSSLARDLYSNVTTYVMPVSSTEAAEMVKLLENTFRAVNIALVNEVALMCNRLKLDVWEIIDAAATKPFGFMPFYPGPGIGGHCIPLDPHYLSWKLKTLNFYSRFIELAGEMNSKMPEHLVQKIVDVLNADGKSIKNSKILILGVAYKKDVGDVRESPALDVIKLLLDKNANISYYDPYVSSLEIEGKNIRSVKSISSLKSFDAAVIVTNHTNIDYKAVVANSKLVIDGRNATKGIKSRKISKL